jgi:ABC-type transport system involved in multi-copper enzyme maturation permease subunit
MTVLTLPAQPGQDTDAALRPIPWRRMAWVTWRQHRATLISVPAVLGAVAVFLLFAGLKVHHDYAAIANCPQSGPNGSNVSSSCGRLLDHFNTTDWTMGNTVLILMQLVPVLLGAFAGAPVLARELESGTFRYAWTQGFGRERWTIAKLALLGVTVAALAGAFGELFAWFFQPFLPVEGMNVLAATVFQTRGVAFAAWALAAFAIGAFFGMLLRRIVPAMAATMGVYLGLDLVTWVLLRKNYPVALVTSNPSFDNGPSTANSPWLLNTWYTGQGGKPANQSVVNQVLALFPQHGGPLPQHGGPRGALKVKETLAQAFAQHGITQWTSYIPVSRFWPMQFIEGGWLLALSVLLIAATVWLVRHRAA